MTAATLPFIQDGIPEELREKRQWVNWRKVPRRNGDKPTKVPVNSRTGYDADITEPANWSTFDEALRALIEDNKTKRLQGLGYAFNHDYTFIDLDGCVNSSGVIESWAQEVIDQVNSFTELSQSGGGVHIIVKYKMRGVCNKTNHVEMYDHKRYAALTGQVLSGRTKIEERDVNWLEEKLLQLKADAKRDTSNSAKDWQLIGEAYREVGANADEIDRWLQENHGEWYKQRESDPKKGPRNGKTHWRYNIDRYLEDKEQELEAETQSELQQTDEGNALRFMKERGEDVRYCVEWKEWMVWDGKRWKRDHTEKSRKLLDKHLDKYQIKMIKAGDKAAAKFAEKSHDTGRQTNALREAQKHAAALVAELDTHPHLVVFKNGTFNFADGQFYADVFERTYLITKMIGHNYDSEAKCPKFLAFLKEQVGEENLQYMQMVCGYFLTGDVGEKCFFLFYGAGDTGKTTFLKVIYRIWGEYAIAIEVDSLMARLGNDNIVQENLSQLQGKRFAYTSEVEENKKISAAVMKRIVKGGGPIPCTPKYEKFREFPETHKLCIDGNHLPRAKASEAALFNRARVIVFGRVYTEEEKVKNYDDELVKEAEGILAWAVQGELLRRQHGLGNEPQAFLRAKNDWRQKMDTIGEFLQDNCVKNANEKVLRSLLFKMYCEEYKEFLREEPISQNEFTRELEMRGFKRNTRRDYYLGLRLKLGEEEF
jgi:putative DNA primase/helicase